MNKKLKLRVFSCIQTVLDVHNLYEKDAFGDELMDEIRVAREKLLVLQNFAVDEDQVESIEDATNNLLKVISYTSSRTTASKNFTDNIH